MDYILPTVKVKSDHPRGYRVINETDFDPKKHELFEGEAAPVYDPREGDSETQPAEDAPGSASVQIPDGWEELNWMVRQKLAKSIDPDFEPDENDRVASIDARIRAELDARAAS